MPPNALRQMRPGEALLIYGHIPPTRLTLRPWYREHSLRALAGMPPANRLRSWRVLGAAGAALVALLVVATAAIGSGAIGGHASADGPAPLSVVHCGDAVESQPSLATLKSGGGWHYRSILGRVALPVANAPLAPVAVTGDILPFWSKFGLLVLTGATPVEISVAPASVGRAALVWGHDAGPATKIRLAACTSNGRWLAYPGGALVKSPGCLPLIIRVGTRRARIRLDASAKKNACALR